VGFSDAVNQTNATLILRTCTGHGTLLQPSKPATAVDSTLLAAAGQERPPGHVLATYTGASVDDVWSYPVLAHQLRRAWSLRLADLWPRPTVPAVGGLRLALRFDRGARCTHDQPAGQCVTAVTATRVDDVIVVLPKTSAIELFSPTLLTVWPVCSSVAAWHGDATADGGWVLLGELAKFVSVSPVRFADVHCSPDGHLTFTVHGDADGPEQLVVTVAELGGSVHALSVTVSLAHPVRIACMAHACNASGSSDQVDGAR